MLDPRGFVAETNATHLFFVTGGIVMTPLTVACPEGITRATVLDLCRRNGIGSSERDVSLMEFYRSDEAFCTGTMGELVGIRQIDGRPIGMAVPGPVTIRLSKLFRELTASEGEL